MYINKVQLYGRLTRDPELKALPSGMSVVSFSLATNREWKNDKGEKQESVAYHNCVCFGKRAEVIAQWVKKGDKFLVEGRIENRSWEKDGVKQYRTEIMIEDFSFGDNPKKNSETRSEKEDRGVDTDIPEYPADEINPEDIPF